MQIKCNDLDYCLSSKSDDLITAGTTIGYPGIGQAETRTFLVKLDSSKHHGARPAW